jgi:hypothetical protein
MALGALSLPAIEPAFTADNTAMVPVTVGQGDKKLGTIEIRSPMDDVMGFFSGIDKSLIKLVEFAKKSFSIEEKEAQTDSLERQDTDTSKEEGGKGLIDTLKESFAGLGDAFDQVSIGEKLGALLLVGAFGVFLKLQDTLVFVLTPIIAGIKKLVEIFGFEGVFATFLGIFLGVKYYGVMAALVVGSKKFLANISGLSKKIGSFFPNGLAGIYKGINKGSSLLLKGAKSTLSAISGGFQGLFNGIGKAFKGIRIGLTAMRLSLLPIVAGFVLPIAIAAAIGAVLFSLKSSIETFKQAIDGGDSVMSALVKAGKDFFATLYTLPFTLIKNVVSYFAGKFGFPNFKEKLDSFDFKQGFINILDNFVSNVKNFFASIFDFDIGNIMSSIGDLGSKMANVLKAVAKGAVAMIAAAVPGGESPTEAFSRVYNSVLSSGTSTEQKSVIDGIGETENSTEGGFNKFKENLNSNSYETNNNTFNNETTTMKEKIKELLLREKEKDELQDKKTGSAPVLVNNTKQGDTINNNSSTFAGAELSTDHTELTQKQLSYAI